MQFAIICFVVAFIGMGVAGVLHRDAQSKTFDMLNCELAYEARKKDGRGYDYLVKADTLREEIAQTKVCVGALNVFCFVLLLIGVLGWMIQSGS